MNGKKILAYSGLAIVCLLLISAVVLWYLAQKEVPEKIIYGMSFNTMYARELGLPWQEVYDAFLDDLQVRHLRLAAHWPMIEPQNNVYNFEELDYQVRRAREVGATVIMGVGRRLPRWPECHVPEWAKQLSWEEQQEEILSMMEIVITRYKDEPAIIHWQIENEPYLEVFAYDHCGPFDESFFLEQVDHSRALDDSRPLLITDSGNIGRWVGPYKHGDAFGTSMYVHFWNPELGQFRTILPAWSYRVKDNIMRLLYGEKETMLIELSAEPWLLAPVTEVPIETQFTRMDLEKFNDILEYAERSRFEKQYLWGAEWWYWLYIKDHTEMWERGRELFNDQ